MRGCVVNKSLLGIFHAILSVVCTTTNLASRSDFVHLNGLFRSKMSFHQALDLIFKLDETTLTSGQLVDSSSRNGIDMGIKDLDLEPKIDAMMREFLDKPNGKLIYNSIMNGPYVKRMIPEPGDLDREVPVAETFHEQTDDELCDKEVKQMEADNQAIHTIIMGLPEDIYAAVNSCETAQEIWLLVEVNELRAEQLARTHDLMALWAHSNNPYNHLLFHQDQPSLVTCMQQPQPNNNFILQPSFNTNYMQQPMPNLEDISVPTTAMNMALVLMDKAFKLNNSTLTNNNQIISLNPRNRQIAQSGMNMGPDKQMQMVRGNGRNLFRQYAEQNVGNLNGYSVTTAEDWVIMLGTAQLGQGDGMLLIFRLRDINEIEEVSASCILMANLQQALTTGTRTDNAPVYDSDGSDEVHHSENCYENDIFNMFTQEEYVEQSGGTVDQNPTTVEETCALYDSLYNNLSIEVEKVNKEIANLNDQLSKEKSTVSYLQQEKKKLKSDFKIREDELLDKQNST
ncbi:hypothetical protein Tco_0079645 [Tanacetum coccineum]